MKTIVNLTRIGEGGGLQNALSFLRLLPEVAEKKEFVVAADGPSVAGEAAHLGYQVIAAKRFRGLCDLDWQCRKHFARGQVCFTLFGHPWRRSVGYLVNVTGVAVSNLFYPEIRFWCHLPTIQQWQKRAIDWFRYNALCSSDYWVFETDILRKRAIQLAQFPQSRASVVRMSPSVLVHPDRVSAARRAGYETELPSGYRLLFLAGANPNKRIHLAALIVKELDQSGRLDRPVSVVTTLDETSNYWRTVRRAFQRVGMSKRVHNLGPIPPTDVSSLLSCCHVVCLFSVLESFSNNMVEAWQMGLPLVATDSDWARDAAGSAAVFISPEEPETAAHAIVSLLENRDYIRSVVAAGRAMLQTYPSGLKKTQAYLECIDRVRHLGPLRKEERASMKSWFALCRSRPTGVQG